MYAITFSDSNSSSSDSDESCNEEGNFSAFMTIAYVESSDDLSMLVEELGEHPELESIGIVDVRLNLINHLVGFIPCQICLYFSD